MSKEIILLKEECEKENKDLNQKIIDIDKELNDMQQKANQLMQERVGIQATIKANDSMIVKLNYVIKKG